MKKFAPIPIFSQLVTALGKPWLPVLAGNGNLDLFNPNEKTTMKTSILVAAIVACALAAPIVSAQELSAPAKPVMSTDLDQQVSQMQENIKKMQQQMEKLRTTTDPKERRNLMQEHMQTMQENMKALRGVGGPMMGSGQRGSMAIDGHKDMAGDDMTQHHEMMEKRMDMLIQWMMD
jgi:TolA-binding protein